MRLRSTPPQSPEHWSKDYVEHLRTVHFALVTVSIGLVVLLSSKPYDAKAAASQMSEVLNHTSKWNLDNMFPETRYSLRINHGTKQESVPFTSPFFAKAAGKWLPFAFVLEEKNQLICDADPADTSHFNNVYREFDPKSYVRSLKTVESWWSAFSKGVDVDRITEIERKTTVDGPGDPEAGVVVEIATPSTKEDGAVTALSSRHTVGLVVYDGTECDPKDPTIPISLQGYDGGRDYNFPVSAIDRNLVLVPSPYQAHSFLTPIPFKTLFPDLVKAADGKEEMDLETLASQIYEEGAKGEDPFEVFGLKFRNDEITRWGIILLVGTQVYFVLYLRQLTNKLKSDDPGWDAPWMAMDQSMFARTVLFISMVLLPMGAAILLIVRAVMAFRPARPLLKWFTGIGTADKIQLALILVGVGASLTFSILAWKYRPKLSEPAAPAQLFE